MNILKKYLVNVICSVKYTNISLFSEKNMKLGGDVCRLECLARVLRMCMRSGTRWYIWTRGPSPQNTGSMTVYGLKKMHRALVYSVVHNKVQEIQMGRAEAMTKVCFWQGNNVNNLVLFKTQVWLMTDWTRVNIFVLKVFMMDKLFRSTVINTALKYCWK